MCQCQLRYFSGTIAIQHMKSIVLPALRYALDQVEQKICRFHVFAARVHPQFRSTSKVLQIIRVIRVQRT